MKTIEWHKQGLIPELLYFQNGGTFTGSVSNTGIKEFRYKLSPNEEKIKAEVWYGPFCYEKSEILDQSEFSMDEEGRSQMLDWLKEKYETMSQ
ncbi:MAG TPA: hypothetical protein VHP31_06195 [Caproicibacter sp.]|nr:hypothetical protein [Caproicibacter sp.]